MQELVQQIKGRKVAEKKFPFLNQENIIFPPNLNLEQASSQDTAEFKKQFFKLLDIIPFTENKIVGFIYRSDNRRIVGGSHDSGSPAVKWISERNKFLFSWSERSDFQRIFIGFRTGIAKK